MKTWTCALTALAVAAAPLASALAARPALTRADHEACRATSEASFRSAVAQVTGRALRAGISRIDYEALVTDQWRSNGIDEVIDRRIDLAQAEVIEETSFLDRLQSIGSSEKAQQIATAMAERVYRSAAVKEAIETVAVGVGREIGRSIEIATIDAAEPTLQCLDTFLGPRHGATVARVVTRDAGRLFDIDPKSGAGRLSTTAVAAEGSDALAGTVLLIVRRQLANLTQRIGQRVVGSVLGRLVSTVAGGIGVVLIAKDIWDFRNGVLPIVASEMKSAEIKGKVRKEIAGTLAEQVGEQADEIAKLTADRILEIWREFQRAHAKVVDLSERHDTFRRFVDLTRPERLGRLDEIVALVVASEGEAAVLSRLDDGTLHRAVEQLPEPAIEIARETRSLTAALAWSSLAGERLDKVVAHELHKHARPAELSRPTLTRLLGLDDKVAITRLASLTPEARTAVLELEDRDLKPLARALPAEDLAQLARYLTGLERDASQRMLRAVAAEPARMQLLSSSRVRDAVLASRDQNAAIGMLLRSGGPFTLGGLREDVQLAVDGRITPILLWDRHPMLIWIAAAVALVLLAMLRRLLFGRRPAARPTPPAASS